MVHLETCASWCIPVCVLFPFHWPGKARVCLEIHTTKKRRGAITEVTLRYTRGFRRRLRGEPGARQLGGSLFEIGAVENGKETDNHLQCKRKTTMFASMICHKRGSGCVVAKNGSTSENICTILRRD